MKYTSMDAFKRFFHCEVVILRKRIHISAFRPARQVFTCKVYTIFKNTFFYRTTPVNASVQLNSRSLNIKY